MCHSSSSLHVFSSFLATTSRHSPRNHRLGCWDHFHHGAYVGVACDDDANASTAIGLCRRRLDGTQPVNPVLCPSLLALPGLLTVETNLPCKGDLIGLCPSYSVTYLNGYPADLTYFYRYKGIQHSKFPLQPIPSILPIRILTRNALLLLLFRTTGTLHHYLYIGSFT